MVHHLTALAEILSTVIGRAHRIALFMRKLALNYVWAETHFIERGGGYRSALAVDVLQNMGFTKVFSMAGGWKAWKESGAPVE